jgi:thioredoxin-related protein
MSVAWNKNVDSALRQAAEENKPLFLDFSAAPMWGGCARLDAEVYPDSRISDFINQNFIAVKNHIKENPEGFQRFGAQWTPTVIIADSHGTERYRFEGFLPVDEFLPQVEFGLAKTDFAAGDFKSGEALFRKIVDEQPNADVAPEALYWAGVAKYKASGDAAALAETATAFQSRYADSVWAKKASIWGASGQPEQKSEVGKAKGTSS